MRPEYRERPGESRETMTLSTIRLELARNHDFPDGSPSRGYEFKAPVDRSGALDRDGWDRDRKACVVRRFWEGEADRVGRLVHRRNGHWLFHYDGMDEAEDEPIFRFDRHHFVEGEYVTITEHDGQELTFRVTSVR